MVYKCLFCQKEVNQLIDAHVIPAWFYRAHLKKGEETGNFNGKSEAIVYDKNDGKTIAKRTKSERKAKMACATCEESFKIDDEWLKSFLASMPKIVSHNEIGSIPISQQNINSAKKFAIGFFMRYCGFMFVQRNIKSDFSLELLYKLYVQSSITIKLSIIQDSSLNLNNSVPDLYGDMFEQNELNFWFLNYVFMLQLDENQDPLIDDILEKCIIPILPLSDSNFQNMVINAKNFDEELQQLPKHERGNFHSTMK